MSPGTASTITEDAFLGGALRLRQPAKGYRITSDSVLLAALVPLRLHLRVLELGLGYGQVALCLIAREPSIHVTGLELMPQAAELARQNARLNGLAACLEVVEGNVATYAPAPVFDVVVANPPYRLAGSHTASADPVKAAATTEQVPLRHWGRAAAAALRPEGTAYFIQDARREADTLAALADAGLGDLTVLPLPSMPGGEALRVAVRARRGAAAVLRLPDYVLHEADGSWRAEIDSVLRTPAELPLWPK